MKLFQLLGFKAYYSPMTNWITIQGHGIDEGWHQTDLECPSFLIKAFGIKRI